MSTLERHPLTAVEADTICAHLHTQGIDLTVDIADHAAHLHPVREFTTVEYVTARWAFMRVTDMRITWERP